MTDPVAEIAQIVGECRDAHRSELASFRHGLDNLTTTMAALDKRVVDNAVLLETVHNALGAVKSALAGDALHPNGLTLKVSRLDADIQTLKSEWAEFKAGIRGLAIGVGLGAGVVGGGVAAAIAQLLGG